MYTWNKQADSDFIKHETVSCANKNVKYASSDKKLFDKYFLSFQNKIPFLFKPIKKQEKLKYILKKILLRLGIGTW